MGDWRSNGLNRNLSHSFGYGLMDTGAMVRVAKEWTNVPKQSKCERHSPYYYKVIPAMGYITMLLNVPECADINVLEHVIAKVHVSAGKKRGDLKIILTSPQGTRSTLLDVRPHDYTSSGFVDWPFMTVHTWGENPIGTWQLTIHNNAYSKWSSDAKFFKWSLLLHGVEYDPNSPEYKVRQKELEQLERKREQELDQRPLRRGISWPMLSNGTSSAENSETADKNLSLLQPRINDITASSTITAYSSNANNESGGGGHHKKVDIQWKGQSSIVTKAGGCISKRLECTQSVGKCRTFVHRNVAKLFCQCSEICSETSSFPDTSTNKDNFNLQCSLTTSDSSHQLKPVSIKGKKPPIWCQFIPFFSYV